MARLALPPSSPPDNPNLGDKTRIYLTVVVVLGATCLLTIVCSVILLLFGREVPDQLWTIAASS
ncbi:MAG: hypothetical protein ACRDEA_16550, partial [Microcystaceae cyanobacterium]